MGVDTETLTTESSVYMVMFLGQTELKACYNDAFHDTDQLVTLMKTMAFVLEKELGLS